MITFILFLIFSKILFDAGFAAFYAVRAAANIVKSTLPSVLPVAKAVIINNHGCISFGRSIATEAAESNAPPTAPPCNDATYETVAALISPIFQDLIDTDRTATSYFRHLNNPEIQKFCAEKIYQKSINYPNLINFDFLKLKLDGDKAFKAFEIFEKNIKGEINRLLLDIFRPSTDSDRQEPAIRAARASLHREIDSLDAPLPDADGDKMATLHDIVPGNTPDPLAILLSREQSATAKAALDALSDAEKERIIAEYDARQLVAKGLLFNLPVGQDDDPTDAVPRIKPRRVRRDRTRQQAFAFAGGAR